MLDSSSRISSGETKTLHPNPNIGPSETLVGSQTTVEWRAGEANRRSQICSARTGVRDPISHSIRTEGQALRRV